MSSNSPVNQMESSKESEVQLDQLADEIHNTESSCENATQPGYCSKANFIDKHWEDYKK